MGADKSSDVLMVLVLNGTPLRADCRTEFSMDEQYDWDTLLDGFEPGCFFEIEDFELQITAPAPDGQASGRSSGGVHLDVITFTRQIDRASMVLLQNGIDVSDFDSAIIVKRRAAGGSMVSGYAYLRYDFDRVLITKIDWTDDHIVKEQITFITRGVQVQYRQQDASGQLGMKIIQSKFEEPVGK